MFNLQAGPHLVVHETHNLLSWQNYLSRTNSKEDLFGEYQELATVHLLQGKVGHQVRTLIHLFGTDLADNP